MKEEETNGKGTGTRGNNSNAWRAIAGRSKPGTTAGTTAGTIDNGNISGCGGGVVGSEKGGSPVTKRSHHGPNERTSGRKKLNGGIAGGVDGSGQPEIRIVDGPTRSGRSNGELDGATAGTTAGTIGNEDNQEEDQTFLEFPKEAYFSDGRLKKSWAEKLGCGKIKDAKPVSTIKRKIGKSFLDDKELLGQVTEGIQIGFKGLDLMADYGLGVSDVWELDDNEAKVLARVLLRRADKGDKAALKTIQTMKDNLDLFQAATVVIPRVGITIKEVAKNGAKPHVKKRTEESIPASGN